MLYIIGCTNRKRYQPVPYLCASTLPECALPEAVAIWTKRVTDAPTQAAAGDLYSGRSFHEASIVFRRADIEGYIVSAGLGLVACDAAVPAYSLTWTGPAEDDVRLKIRGDWSPGMWWNRINVARTAQTGIAALVEANSDSLTVVALSETYARMVADDLASLGEADLGRLRIIGPRNAARLPARLRPYLMPFDSRLDGPAFPIPGTRTDFAARAGRWFVEEIASTHPEGSADCHATAVSEALAQFSPPPQFSRSPRMDEEIADLILVNWERAEGKSSRMLRILRDNLGIACEQNRFARLFRETAARRKGGGQ